MIKATSRVMAICVVVGVMGLLVFASVKTSRDDFNVFKQQFSLGDTSIWICVNSEIAWVGASDIQGNVLNVRSLTTNGYCSSRIIRIPDSAKPFLVSGWI